MTTLLKGQDSTIAAARRKKEKYFSHPGQACKQAVHVKTCETLHFLGWFLSSPEPKDLKAPSEAAAALINIVIMEMGRSWHFPCRCFCSQNSLFPFLQHHSVALLNGLSCWTEKLHFPRIWCTFYQMHTEDNVNCFLRYYCACISCRVLRDKCHVGGYRLDKSVANSECMGWNAFSSGMFFI